MRFLGKLGITVTLALLALSPAVAYADAEIPGGRFFTEALPDRDDGGGFAVQDGHGAKLWTAFGAAGGTEGLGYPISRRFDLDGGIAQAFVHAVLRWDPATDQVETLGPLVKLPAAAIEPDQPPRAAADAEQRPWSGWWWPASDGMGATLFAANGPLEKYDRYVTLVTGESPGTRAWEREQLYFPGNLWAGHCNGFAAAALLEPEPTEPKEILGITFSVGDLKGLLVDYHFGDAAAWAFPDADNDLDPADFHGALLNWMQVEGKGFVMTFDLGGGEVWSYPAYRFESEWTLDPVQNGVWRVKTTVWMADMEVPPNFVGLKPFPGPAGKILEYTLEGDPRNPSGGAWTGASRQGRFAHPGRIWYPEPLVRNLDRELVSPGLDRETVANIIDGSDGSDAFNPDEYVDLIAQRPLQAFERRGALH
jgi:hypothetical protein